MEVERVVAGAPGHGALLVVVGHLVGLAVNTGLVDMALADGAAVDVDFCKCE